MPECVSLGSMPRMSRTEIAPAQSNISWVTRGCHPCGSRDMTALEFVQAAIESEDPSRISDCLGRLNPSSDFTAEFARELAGLPNEEAKGILFAFERAVKKALDVGTSA